jgi:hypothetical protein
VDLLLSRLKVSGFQIAITLSKYLPEKSKVWKNCGRVGASEPGLVIAEGFVANGEFLRVGFVDNLLV